MSLQDASGSQARPIDELMASYAAGRLSRPLQCLVAAHLAIRPENRTFVAAMEALCGKALEDIPASQPISGRDAKLAAIFDDRTTAIEPATVLCPIVPPPLANLLGKPVKDVPWRTRLPGIREFEVKGMQDCEAKLYWIRPGRVMPSHTHDGSEVTLVLRGGFSVQPATTVAATSPSPTPNSTTIPARMTTRIASASQSSTRRCG